MFYTRIKHFFEGDYMADYTVLTEKDIDEKFKNLRKHNVILGASGSGKTFLAKEYMQRAMKGSKNRVLFVAYNKIFTKSIWDYFLKKGYFKGFSERCLFEHFEYDPYNLYRKWHTLIDEKRLIISNYHKLCSDFFAITEHNIPRYDARKLKYCFDNTEDFLIPCGERTKLIKEAISRVDINQSLFLDEEKDIIKIDFVSEEIKFIQNFGLRTFDQYKNIERKGMITPLYAKNREYYWSVFLEYQKLLTENNFHCDAEGSASILLKIISNIPQEYLFDYIIIDEGQDLGPIQIKSLVKLLKPNGKIVYFGDPTQSIYGSKISWKTAGLEIHKIERMETNYRNTAEINRFCLDVLSLLKKMPENKEEIIYPKSGDHEGKPVFLIKYSSIDEKQAFSEKLIRKFYNEEKSVACLYDKKDKIIKDQWISNRNGQLTFHSSKGLDFDNVLLFDIDKHFGNLDKAPTNKKNIEWFNRAVKLFYVACTRAKKRLFIFYSDKLSPVFPIKSKYYESYEITESGINKIEKDL